DHGAVRRRAGVQAGVQLEAECADRFTGPCGAGLHRLADHRAQAGRKRVEDAGRRGPRATLYRDRCRCRASAGHERSQENRGYRGVGGRAIGGNMVHDYEMRGNVDRRCFMMCALASGAALGVGEFSAPLAAMPSLAGSQKQDDSQFTVEAKFYQKLPNKKIKCKLCPRECTVGDRERGYCGVRENRAGTYFSLVHSRVCTAHVDPIEKKPLFHYLPGTVAFSLATAGCNVNCKFCQNWDISQSRPEQVPADYIPPQRVVELAKQYGCPTIAYTYSEPVVFSEFLMDAADAGHQAGIRSIVVSNGYMQQEALKAAYGKMDAVKIDLKAFTESYYR